MLLLFAGPSSLSPSPTPTPTATPTATPAPTASDVESSDVGSSQVESSASFLILMMFKDKSPELGSFSSKLP